jgi:imidazolonepropionase-like amidohydrolase
MLRECWDVASGSIVTPGEVLVEGDRIVAAGSHVEHPTGAEVIDLGDTTLMPGLIDGACASFPACRG